MDTKSEYLDKKSSNKILAIDILRGIAILAVILVHTAQQIDGTMWLRSFAKYGQMGVQLFFVVSAFTLCYSFESRKKEDNRLFKFYIRRFFRIAPGYYFGILFYALLSLTLGNVWNRSDNFLDIILNIFFLNGLVPSANNSVVPGGWSIGTEMLFYLIFPLLYTTFKVLQKKIKYFYLVFPLIFSLLSIIAQIILFAITKNSIYSSNNSFVYFSILNQLPVFCVGISFFYYFMKNPVENWMSKTKCGFLFFVFSFISLAILFKVSSIPIFHINTFPLISGISFVYLFMLIHQINFKESNIFSNIGVLSFSSYIVHFAFTFYLAKYISTNILKTYSPDIELIIIYPFVVFLTYFTSKVIYRIIELNGLKLGKKIIENNEKNRNEKKIS